MKTLPLDVALKTCAEVGYSHVELALNAGYPSEPKVFTAEARQATAAQLQALKLDLPCLMLNISLTADDKAHAAALQSIADAAQVARDSNPTSPAIIETVFGRQASDLGATEGWHGSTIARLGRSSGEGEDRDHHQGPRRRVPVNSPERLLWLLEQVKSPAIQVAYDYSHFELQGIDMEESMKLRATAHEVHPCRRFGRRSRQVSVPAARRRPHRLREVFHRAQAARLHRARVRGSQRADLQQAWL